MANTIFSEWLSALGKLQASVSKDLEEIRQQKAEIQALKVDILNKVARGKYIHDNERIVLSAPEIVLGNVDASGMLLSEGGSIIIRGQKVGLEGVGNTGTIESRATVISQIAIDPGPDGIEEVVRDDSSIVQQAKRIAIQSNDVEKDGYFIGGPIVPAASGVRIHADEEMDIDVSKSVEVRSAAISDRLKDVTSAVASYTADSTSAMAEVSAKVAEMETLLTAQDLLDIDEVTMRTTVAELDSLTEQFNEMLPSIYDSLDQAIKSMSLLAEYNLRLKALQNEQVKVSTEKASFKDQSTGAFLNVSAEQMSFASVDGDGNIRDNEDASIRVQTGKLDVTSFKKDGSLIDDSRVTISTHDVAISTVNPKLKKEGETDGDYTTEGSVKISSKDVSVTAVDYSIENGAYTETDQTKDSSFSVRTENIHLQSFDKDMNSTGTFFVEAEQMNFVSLDKDDNTTGSVGIAAKDMNIEAIDKDGATIGHLNIQAENMSLQSHDKSGKAIGQFCLNSKDVFVKSMDTDDKGADKSIAAGGNMVLVAEKMFVGRTDKDNTSKELQISSDKTGIFGTTTAEVQQGEAKAVIQLDGGNIAIGGSKAEFFGDNTVNGKTDFKGDVTAPKLTADNMEAKTSFKSKNISDGIAVPGAAASAKVSAKLTEADAPKPQEVESEDSN